MLRTRLAIFSLAVSAAFVASAAPLAHRLDDRPRATADTVKADSVAAPATTNVATILALKSFAVRHISLVATEGVIVAGGVRNLCAYGDPAEFTPFYDAPEGNVIGKPCFTTATDRVIALSNRFTRPPNTRWTTGKALLAAHLRPTYQLRTRLRRATA